MSALGGGGDKCTICEKTAYPAETISYEKKPYHNECFRCKECDKKLTPSTVEKFEEVLYCKHCFQKNGFAQKQKNVQWTKPEGSSSAGASKFGGGGVPCQSCTKSVYPAELISYEKLQYHSGCFNCQEEGCDKKMGNANNCGGKVEAEDGSVKVICKKCWLEKGYNRKQVAKKSDSSSASEGAASSSKFGGGGTPCHVCAKSVYPAELVSYEKLIYHSECFKCSDAECGKKIGNPSNAGGKLEEDDGSLNVYCKKCWLDKGYNRKQVAKKSDGVTSTPSAVASKFGGGGTPCTVCAKSVFPAELVSYEKMSYHADCFCCQDEGCKRKIAKPSDCGGKLEDEEDPSIVRIYCKKCWLENGYNRKQTVKKADGSAPTSSAPSKFGGGGTKCVKCDKTVYPAELIQYEKQPYHNDCFKCSSCDAKIQAGTAQYHKEKGLFCKKCWNEQGLFRAENQ